MQAHHGHSVIICATKKTFTQTQTNEFMLNLGSG